MAETEETKTEITGNRVPVFLGWSGKASKETAKVLHKYLPSLINALEPFVSDEDIEKGSVWRTKIAEELEKSECGILCLTPENIKSLWIHFEAGALSKRVVESRACTFLMGLKPSDLEGPLTDFQSTSRNEEDFFKLVKTLNSACGSLSQSEERLKVSFDALWPKIKDELSSIEQGLQKNKATKAISSKKQEVVSSQIRPELLEELVVRLRGQDERLSNIENDIREKPTIREYPTVGRLMSPKRIFLSRVRHHIAQEGIECEMTSVDSRDNIFFKLTKPVKTLSGKLLDNIMSDAECLGLSIPTIEHDRKGIHVNFD